MDDERRNIRLLIRWVSSFVAWPSLSIGLAMAVWEFQEHVLHIAGFIPLGTAALIAFFKADALSRRFVPDDPLAAAAD